MAGGRLLLTDELRRMADPIWEESIDGPFITCGKVRRAKELPYGGR